MCGPVDERVFVHVCLASQRNMRVLLKYSALAQKCLERSYKERSVFRIDRDQVYFRR